jgi:inner membrane protein
MDALLTILGGWTWWVVAGVLLIAELAAPGVFFIWLALAAATLGVITLAVDISWQWQLTLFAVLSLAILMIAKPWLKWREARNSEQPNLNRRMLDFVGKSYVLDQPIVNGHGKIRINDTLWDATGPDSPKGHWVKVLRVDGLKLAVEPISKPK